MASKMNANQVALLREFIKVVASKPEILHLPELGFFKEWLLKMGANIPAKEEPAEKPKPKPEPELEPEPEPEPKVPDPDDMETASPASEASKEPEKQEATVIA